MIACQPIIAKHFNLNVFISSVFVWCSFSSCDPLETMVKKARAKTAAGYKNGMIRPKTGMKRSGTDSSGLSNKSSNGSSSNGNSENYPQIIRPDTASHFPTSRGLVHQKR